MNRRTFLASIPVGPMVLIPSQESKSPEFTSSRLFKYMSQRGRPFAMFTMPKGYSSLWFYWIFEDESSWKLPPEGWRDSASCTGCPREWGWHAFEGNCADLVAGIFSGTDFPDTSVIEHYSQEQFHKLLLIT